MTTSLIVTTYNRPDALEAVLRSIQAQTSFPGELIVADDGSKNSTKLLIEKWQKLLSFPVKHVWQEDKGFRLARIRNKAIAVATGEYLIMIDGDVLLHPEFIRDHLRASKEGTYVQGGRVLISAEQTEFYLKEGAGIPGVFSSGLLNRLNAISSPFLSSLFSVNKKHYKSVRGCNMAFWRKDVLLVNGFNEDFEGWGKEDTEFVVRLLIADIDRYNLKFGGVCFHLDHGNVFKEENRVGLEKNISRLNKVIVGKQFRCDSGIGKHLKHD